MVGDGKGAARRIERTRLVPAVVLAVATVCRWGTRRATADGGRLAVVESAAARCGAAHAADGGGRGEVP